MIICDEGGENEYEDIVYDGLFSLVDEILAIPEDIEEVRIADENASKTTPEVTKLTTSLNSSKKIMFPS